MDRKKKWYLYRKENHLCVNCGERTNGGNTRCERCRQILAVKEKERYEKLSDDEKHEKYLKNLAWRKKNPDKVAVYSKRKSDYNRKYNWGGLK